MPKKQVAVTLRKPQAPAEVDRFVGGERAPDPVRTAPLGPIEAAVAVQHGARDYREMTLYLPTDVVRELSLYCMDRNCDVSRVVADAVSKHVTGEAAEPAAHAPSQSWSGRLESLVEQVRAKLMTIRALRT